MEKNTSGSINKYSHLTLKEREEIALGLEIGLTQREIASNLNRSPSTISREIKRNKLYIRGAKYRAAWAQFQTDERNKNSRKKSRIHNKKLRRSYDKNMRLSGIV